MTKMKWFGLLAIVLAGLYGAMMWYFTQLANPGVIDELRSNPNGERAKIAMLLSLPDGKVIPVNYLREGDLVFVGADGPWWRAFNGDGASVEVFIQGQMMIGNAKAVLDDIDYTRQVFSRLRPKTPAGLPDWLNGKLIVIQLTDRASLSIHTSAISASSEVP